jgi:hypothetical protein
MDIRVNDEFVVEGNVAVLKCLIQNLMPDFATDIVWHISDGLIIKANETKGKERDDLYEKIFYLFIV